MASGRIARLWCVGALIVASARAQTTSPVNTDTFEVTLSGIGCDKVPDTIHVVVNGDDQDGFDIDRGGGRCRWSGRRPEGAVELLPAFFSLRLGGARTPCHHAIPANQQSVAKLIFTYEPESAYNVDITARDVQNKRLYIAYVRSVRAANPAKGDLDCAEKGLLKETGPHLIYDVNSDVELLRLQLPKMDPDDPGLLVNDEAVLEELKKGNHVVLSEIQVREALAKQVAAGTRAAPPVNPGNWRVSDKNMITTSRLKSLEIKVP
jgi:hypothetical protein